MPQVPLYLFARNNKNTDVGMYGYCRCLGFCIKKSTGEVVMDLKPCMRNTDRKAGLIDLISGRFFMNEGTGDDFSAGAEVKLTDGYEALDYVTFSKNKLYDLGIVNSTQTIEVMFARSEKSTTPYLYGCVTSPHTASVTAYLSNGGAWRFGSSYKGLTTNNTFINRVIVANGTTNFNFTAGTFTKSTFTGIVTGVINSSKKCGVFVEIPQHHITGMVAMKPEELVNYKPGQEIIVKITGFEEEMVWNKVVQQMQHAIPYVIEDNKLKECSLKPILELV
jgi:hypothetical protein